MPAFFLQDDIYLSDRHKLLLGMRYDYHTEHGNIYTPRFAYKWKFDTHNVLRLNAGTGFRW
ncbi:MAG: TonB-dependent receptor [Owenweeksia sp.]|nr:TonB-dependent receptor [Owenweeksia sp.]